MKLKSISIYMLSLAGMLGLWSCSTDEAISEGGLVASGEKVPVTITISRGAQTRTELSENTTNGGLNQVWSEGDVVELYNSDGAKAGTLTLQSGANTPDGIFKGEVTGETGTYRLWYFGKPQADAENPYPYLDFSTTEGQVKLDLQNQNFRSLNELEAVDILSTDVNIVVKNEQGIVGQTVTMNPHVAMARFTISGIPDGTSGTVKIYNNLNSDRGGIYAKQPLLLSTGVQQGGNTTTTSFTYDEVNNGEDIYVAFIPNAYTLHFEFEASNGAKYTHTFGQNDIEAGVYYRSFNKEDGEETGTIEGIEVPMQLSEKYTLRYHANFEGAEPESFEDVQYKAPAVFTLKGYADTGLSSREGYTFLGWANSASATQPDITGSSITLSEDDKNTPRDVYAVWEKIGIEIKDPNNPGDMSNWGGAGELIAPKYTDTKDTSKKYKNGGWCNNDYSIYLEGGWCDPIIYHSNGIVNGALYSTRDASPSYYQWGRWMGFPYNDNMLIIDSFGQPVNNYWAEDNAYALGESIKDNGTVRYQNTQYGSVYGGYFALMATTWWLSGGWDNAMAIKSSIIFGGAESQPKGKWQDYLKTNENCKWEDRAGNPCPDGWRIPTISELVNLIPGGQNKSVTINGSYAEVREVKGEKFAFCYKVSTNEEGVKCLNIVSVRTNKSSVTVNDPIFNGAPILSIGAYGMMNFEGGRDYYNDRAYVWSCESQQGGNYSGYAGAALRIIFSGNNATISTTLSDRINGAIVVPIRDPEATHTDIRPWFPHFTY